MALENPNDHVSEEEMPTFTILDPSIYLPLLSEWYPSLGKCVGLSIISGGLANSNYCLETDAGRFLLKVCDEKSVEELLVQAQALEALRLLDFKCPYVHPHGHRSRALIAASDPQHCVLQVESPSRLRIMVYDFLPGRPGSVTTMTPKMIYELGLNLARLHLID